MFIVTYHEIYPTSQQQRNDECDINSAPSGYTYLTGMAQIKTHWHSMYTDIHQALHTYSCPSIPSNIINVLSTTTCKNHSAAALVLMLSVLMCHCWSRWDFPTCKWHSIDGSCLFQYSCLSQSGNHFLNTVSSLQEEVNSNQTGFHQCQLSRFTHQIPLTILE